MQTSLFKFLLVKPGFESSVVLLLLGTLDVGETRDVGKPIDSKGCLCSSRSSSMMWSFLWVILKIWKLTKIMYTNNEIASI